MSTRLNGYNYCIIIVKLASEVISYKIYVIELNSSMECCTLLFIFTKSRTQRKNASTKSYATKSQQNDFGQNVMKPMLVYLKGSG